MQTYNNEYSEIKFSSKRLNELKLKYNDAVRNNFMYSSYVEAEDYRQQLEEDMIKEVNNSIDITNAYIDDIKYFIKNNITNLSPKELSIIYAKLRSLNDTLSMYYNDLNSLQSQFSLKSYNYINTSNMEDEIHSIEEYSLRDDIVPVYLGELSSFSFPFIENYSIRLGFGFVSNPKTDRIRYHNGYDFIVPQNTEIRSIFNGIVVRADDRNDRYHNNIKISCGNDIVIHYGNLAKRNFEVGDIITQNDVIGLSGNNYIHIALFYKGEAIDLMKLYG